MSSERSVDAKWPVRRLQFLAQLNPSRTEVRDLPPATKVSFVPMEAVGEYGGLSALESRPLESVYGGFSYFRDGDVVVAKITPCFENGKGAVAAGLIDGVAFGTTELHVLRPGPELDQNFLFYLTISQPFRDGGAAAMTGAAGQKRVPEEFLRNYRVGLPPMSIQRSIADFLDEKTAAIDALIAKKERLIELIEEKRQATITRAVTKGLDPDVPMKDSGIEWLGEVPAHWHLSRLKHLVDQPGGIQMGPFGASLTDLASEDTGIKLYGQENTISGDFTAGNRWIWPDQYTELARYELRTGDIVLTRKGSIGNCRIVPSGIKPGIIDSDTIRVRVGSKVDYRFLQRALHDASYIRDQVFSNRRGAVLAGLNSSNIAELWVAVPPSHEQEGIVATVDQETAAINSLVAGIEHQITRLREYRQTLISAAVTGQLDLTTRTTRARKSATESTPAPPQEVPV